MTVWPGDDPATSRSVKRASGAAMNTAPLSAAPDRKMVVLGVVACVLAALTLTTAILYIVAPDSWAVRDTSPRFFESAWPNAVLEMLLTAIYTVLAVLFWRSASARVWIDEEGVTRGSRADARGLRGFSDWFVPFDEITDAEIRLVGSRPHLVISRSSRPSFWRGLATVFRESRTDEEDGSFSRIFLWRHTPRGSVVAPIDPEAADTIRDILSRASSQGNDH